MRSYDDITSMGGPNRRFPVTEWTKFQDPAARKALWADLCQQYWKPVYMYLRTIGFDNDKAKDLVQGFFTDKVLGRELIDKADKTKGRFRDFLKKSAKNYALNLLNQQKPLKILDERMHDIGAPDNPEAEFDIAWAKEVLREVLKELEEECRIKGKIAHWQVFQGWFLEPDIESNKIMMNDLCTKYKVANPSMAYNMISNIKKRFRLILRRHLRPLVESDAEVNDEISKFISYFSGNSAR